MGLNNLRETLFYKVIRIVVPNLLTGLRETKWYARVVHMGRFTMPMMEDDIVNSTTATRADVRAVLTAMSEIVWKRLREGQIVELPPVGNFRLTIQNKGGAETKSAWTPALIKGSHLDFQPTGGMRSVTADLSYHRWGSDTNEVADKLRTLQEKVNNAADELATAEAMHARFEKEAAAEPDNKSLAMMAAGAAKMVESDKVILQILQENLETAKAKAQEGLDDLAALGIYL
jgi:predicted histone-like DNA-binding protein